MSTKRPRPTDAILSSKLASFACKRCRLRKVKCDAELPCCGGCSKAAVPCIVADYSTTRDYTREEVHFLEQKLAQLETLLSSNSEDTGLDIQSHPTSDSTRFVGPECSISFIQPIIDTIRTQRRSLPARQEPTIEYHAPHYLPSREVALGAIAEYFREFHVCHPFLNKEEKYAALDHIYGDLACYRGPVTSLSSSQKHNLYQLYMILAIGGIRLFRDHITHFHPFGFFTAALEVNPPSEYSFSAIGDVENLLLISFFGVYYNIGCSVWELARLCVRICIELQFHRRRVGLSTSCTAEDQKCRRVFWESYLLDRFASSMLGRPFAIDDSVIDAELPIEPSEPVFNHLVRLGRITSAIHVSTYYQRSMAQDSLDNSDLMALRNFHTQLRIWRLQVPDFESYTCFYETEEFFELTYQESRLWLFRVAINKLPPSSSNMRDKLHSLCLQAAQRIIECFNVLWQNNLAIYSRAFTRLILISGMITVSVIKMQACTQNNHRKEHIDSDVEVDVWLRDVGLDSSTCFPTLSACRDTLETAGKILSWLAMQMPDVSAYAQIFETLKREVDLLSPSIEAHPAQQFPPYESVQPSGVSVIPSSDLGNRQALESTNGEGMLPDSDGLLGNDVFWSFADAPWMEEIDDNISGFIWDTIMPWNGSPLES